MHGVLPGKYFHWAPKEIGHKWTLGVDQPYPDDPQKKISMQTLSRSPRVFSIDNFLSDDEINYLVEHAEAERSHVGIGKETFNRQRTSKTAWDTSSEVSLRIQRRAFDLVRVPTFRAGRCNQVIKYDRSQMYLLHTIILRQGTRTWIQARRTGQIDSHTAHVPDGRGRGGHTVFPFNVAS